jgi:hypothetical protein
MAENQLKPISLEIESYIHQRGLTHLHAMVHGKHIIIYSSYDGEKEPRARLSQTRPDVFRLSMSDQKGRWEATPYIRTTDKLLEILLEQFGFTLIDF